MALKPTRVTASSRSETARGQAGSGVVAALQNLGRQRRINGDEFDDPAGVGVVLVQEHQQLRENPRGGRQRFYLVDVIIQRLHNL